MEGNVGTRKHLLFDECESIYCVTYEDACQVIQKYEIDTNSSFFSRSTSHKDFGMVSDLSRLKKFSIRFEDRNTSKSIKLNGVPFIVCNTKRLLCSRGSNHNSNKRVDEEDRDRVSQANAILHPTMKVNCPASIILREIITFPDYKLQHISAYKQKQLSSKLRNEIQKNPESVKFERRFYVQLPHIEEHKGHSVKDQSPKVASQDNPFEKLLEDLKDEEPVDVFQMYPIKKRYLKWLKCAYETEEHNTELSDAECVSDWVQKCSNLEECPILFCHQENVGFENEKFILVIMTEFQKHILMSASKQVICVDAVHRISEAQLVVILIMDELNTAFPAAYCISNKLNKDVMSQFFTCVKESAGSLSPKYLMSSHARYIYDSWVKVMGYRPRWLWSRWNIEVAVKAQLRNHVTGDVNKYELFKTVLSILDCRNEEKFLCRFRNFTDILQNDERLEKLGNSIMKMLGSDTERWASCYQQEIDFRTILHLEVMHHTFLTCCSMGKRKRLYTFLSVIMKLLRHKMLDRILGSFDEEKLCLAENAINLCHVQGMDISPEQISALSDKLWLIQSEDSEIVYVTRETEKCPEFCNLKCKECNICVHQYSCSCVHSMINANLCLHIHAVVYKFLGPPELTSSNSNEDLSVNGATYDIPPQTVVSVPQQSNISTQFQAHDSFSHLVSFPSLDLNTTDKSSLEIALCKSMEIYQSIQSNSFSQDMLTTITMHLNELLNIINNYKSKCVVQTQTIPINAVYVIKPQNKVSERVLLPKPSVKRSVYNLYESSSRSKLQKTDDTFSVRDSQNSETHSSSVLVLNSKESD